MLKTVLEFQKGNYIVLQAEQERLEMAAEQDVEERLELEQRRRDAEGLERALRKRHSWTLVDDAQGGAIVQP